MFGIFLTGLSVGLSNFSGAISIGLAKISTSLKIRAVVLFGIFELIMPIIGMIVGKGIASSFFLLSNDIGAGVFMVIGLYMLFRIVIAKHKNEKKPTFSMKHIVILAFVLSLDNLCIGFALGLRSVPVLLSGIIIAVESTLLTLIGMLLGRYAGAYVEKWAEELSAVILIGIGVAFLLGFF